MTFLCVYFSPSSKQNTFKHLSICYNALNNKTKTNNVFGEAHFYWSVFPNGEKKNNMFYGATFRANAAYDLILCIYVSL